MIVRTIGVLVYGLLSLMTVLALILGYLAIQLRHGELPLTGIEPFLHDLVEARSGDMKVGFSAPALRLAPATGELELVVSDLLLQRADGELVASAPRAAIDPDIRGSLLFGRLMLRAVSIIAPTLELRRELDGGYGLALLGASLPGMAAATADRPRGVAEALRSLLGGIAEGPGPALIRIEDATVTLRDERTGATLQGVGAQLTIDRERGDASSSVRFPHESGDAWISASARSGKASGVTELSGTFSGLVLQRLVPWIEVPDLLQHATLPLGGTLKGELGGPGDGVLHLQASARGQTLEVPELLAAPLPVTTLLLEAELHTGTMLAKIERLVVESGEARLEGEGTLTAESGRMAFRFSGIEAAKLKSSWPSRMAPAAHAWIDANLPRGKILKGLANLSFGDGGPLLEGEFQFSQVTVRFQAAMPRALELAGTARFGPAGLDFALERGRIGGLEVTGGKVKLEHLGAPVGHARVQLDLRGSIQAALELVRQAPGKSLDSPLADLRRVRGSGSYEVEIDLPLAAALDVGDVILGLRAALTDVNAPDIVAGRDLTRGTLSLTLDAKQVELAGSARIADVPIDRLVLVHPLLAGAANRFELTTKARVTPAQLVTLGLPVVEGLSGVVGVELELQVPKKGPLAGNILLDLEQAAFHRPDLPLAKRPGAKGTARADFTADAGSATLADLRVDLPQIRAHGRLEIDLKTGELRRLALQELVAAGSRLAVTLVQRPDGGYSGKVTGKLFDLTPWVSSERRSTAPAPGLDLTIDVEELAFGEARFRDLRGRLVRDAAAWQEIKLDAGLPPEGRLELRLKPGSEKRQLRIRADDAGAVLEAIDPTADFARGGSFALDAELLAESPVYRMTGSIKAAGFRIVQAPFLARLLSLATISGLAGQLQGTGIAIDQARVEFSLTGNKVTLLKGRMSGSGLGLTMGGTVDLGNGSIDLSGTLVPLYGLNSLLGQIPILGWILRGGDGLGAFAATYTARGPLREPDITVNPLSFVVPGMLRDLIDVLPVEATPPEPPATRD